MSHATIIETLMIEQPNVSFFLIATYLKKYFPQKLSEFVEIYKTGGPESILNYYYHLDELDSEQKHRRYISNSIIRWKDRGIDLVDKSIAKILLPFAEHVYEVRKVTHTTIRHGEEKVYFDNHGLAQFDTIEYRKFILNKAESLKQLNVYGEYYPGCGKNDINPWLWMVDFDLSLVIAQRKNTALDSYQSYFEKTDLERLMMFIGIAKRNIKSNNKYGYLIDDADKDVLNNIMNSSVEFIKNNSALAARWFDASHLHDAVVKKNSAFTKIATYVRKILNERDEFYLKTFESLSELTTEKVIALAKAVKQNADNRDELDIIISDEFIDNGSFDFFVDIDNLSMSERNNLREMAKIISKTHYRAGFRKLLSEIK